MFKKSSLFSKKNESILYSCLNYVKKHPIYAVLSAFVIVLAYGFYATKYTYNLDQLVPEYYDSNVLITAGRWVAPTIHFFTNWMQFSPFWHTVLMMALFWLSGLCWINLFKKVSNEQIKDTSLLVFWCLFPVYPIITYQLTYPILNITLAYVLTPVSIWLLYPIFFEKQFKIKNLLIALLFMIASVDMYESFAPVFLTGICAVLILNYIFSIEQSNNTTGSSFKFSISVLLKTIAFLVVVITLDFLVSKIICYISSGSFEFWFNHNMSTNWFSYGGPIDALIWFLRDILAHYFIMGAGDFSILFFDVMLFASIIIAIVFTIKRRSPIPVILFLCLFVSSISLCLVVGASYPYRTEQALPVYAAFVFMLLFQFAANKKVTAYLLSAITVILVFSETQQINNYAVKNYEIFEYGYSRLREIGNELEKYDTSKKTVVFVSNKDAKLYPAALSIYEKSTNPLYSAYSKIACKFWNSILSTQYYHDMQYGSEIETNDCETLIIANKTKAAIYIYPILNGLSYNLYHTADGYEALKRMGYEYIPCTKDEYEEAQNYLVPDDKTKKFIVTETNKMIIVQLMAVEQKEK